MLFFFYIYMVKSTFALFPRMYLIYYMYINEKSFPILPYLFSFKMLLIFNKYIKMLFLCGVRFLCCFLWFCFHFLPLAQQYFFTVNKLMCYIARSKIHISGCYIIHTYMICLIDILLSLFLCRVMYHVIHVFLYNTVYRYIAVQCVKHRRNNV